MIIKKNGDINFKNILEPKKETSCSFERIYFSRGNDKDFYKGQRVTVMINYSECVKTDIEARLFARNIGKLIAGKPQVISKNMAGAGGTVATTYLGLNARKDGLTMG